MNTWDPALINACQQETGIFFARDSETLTRTSTDFGLLNHGYSHAVAIPHDARSSQRLFLFANEHRLPLTLRAKGFSQGGQTVSTPGGVIVETAKLDKVNNPSLETLTVTCQAGATWQSVVEKTIPLGLLPRVMPFNLELTVGGVLSVGGTGGTTHRYGHVVNNVTELEVITGNGEHQLCSPQNNPELFYATLGGVGHVCMIISATLSLRCFKSHVRSFYLLYDDHQAWLSDQLLLSEDNRCDYLEGFCSSSMQGLRNTSQGRKPFMHWFYPLQIACEYEPGTKTDIEEVLKGLRYYKHLHSEDNETENFAARYSPRFSLMRKMGAFELVHPWLECLLPYEAMKTLLPDFLASLPPALGDGHRVYPIAPSRIPSSFILPESSTVMGFTILPMGVPSYSQNEVLETLRKLHLRIVSAGGKRYLSGWLDTMDESAWKQHYGPHYNTWMKAKQSFDPNRTLRSMLFPT